MITQNRFKEGKDKNIGIYQILNTMNGKMYIGSSGRLVGRKIIHFNKLRRGKHPNRLLQNDFNCYGGRAFKFDVLFNCRLSDIFKVEQFYIDITKSYDSGYGYNLRKIANGNKRRMKDVKIPVNICIRPSVVALAMCHADKLGISFSQFIERLIHHYNAE